ncbi:hypothetical protein FGG08_006294 [Glutinoglossum americanum]|uniref:Uncharacterized protein n=1 Tax=Glutinoglossum americanum TaxID=1670608 RepID=A0A9P8I3R1_9PEZI|nr:hypothetical protein FGG08_006294 [Glutinoglossum americanum]
MEQDQTFKFVLAHQIDRKLVDAVFEGVKLSDVSESLNTCRIESGLLRLPVTFCSLKWTDACFNVLRYFQTVIQPHTGLSGVIIRQYSLTYFPRGQVTSGSLDMPMNNNYYFVIICIKYNSRFPRFMRKELDPISGNCPRPAPRSAPELELEPGQIAVFNGESFVEFPAGYDGTHKTVEGAEEGADGGFAILLCCDKQTTGTGS